MRCLTRKLDFRQLRTQWTYRRLVTKEIGTQLFALQTWTHLRQDGPRGKAGMGTLRVAAGAVLEL